MMKLVFDRETATILGVHIIGTDACASTAHTVHPLPRQSC
jgi:pyruvate/2-oxoglutarate dehydrogenase complex dihydrolipoamide dehydrogenase (E3) component